jgi:GntR family phosphonate transport system transcriptional regulator
MAGLSGMIARGEGVSAWRQVADRILAGIEAGDFGPAAQLPTEASFAETFGVNRHTIRRALAVLAEEGVVRATQGRGTFVAERPLPYRIGARTRFSELVAAAGREAEGRLIVAAETVADMRVAAALQIAEGAPVLRLETLRSADRTPICLSVGWFPLPRFAGLPLAYRRSGGLSMALGLCGVPDYDRLETRISARLPLSEEVERLALGPGRAVLTVDSVNADRAGTRIQFTRAVFAADRVELVVES